MEVTRLRSGGLEVAGDTLDILHHEFRLREDRGIDTLEHALVLTGQRNEVGRIDESAMKRLAGEELLLWEELRDEGREDLAVWHGREELGLLSQGLDSLQDGRVRVLEEDKERVWGEIGEIFSREFFERTDEVVWGSLVLFRVGVSLELMLPRPEVHGETYEEGDGSEEDAKESEADIEGLRVRESKGLVDGAADGGVWGGEDADEVEDDGDLDDGEGDTLDNMLTLEVSYLMG